MESVFFEYQILIDNEFEIYFVTLYVFYDTFRGVVITHTHFVVELVKKLLF